MNGLADPAMQVVHILDPDAGERTLIEQTCASVGLAVRGYALAGQLLESLDERSSGCIVSALSLAHIHGLEVQARLIERRIDLPVIMISDRADVSTVREVMRQGALDFFEKPVSGPLLLRRIQEGLALHEQWAQQRRRRQDAIERVGRLSPKEKQVVDLLMEGMGNKQIAFRLQLSVKAVEARRRRIREKLCVKHFPALVYLVLDSQLPAPMEPGWWNRRLAAAG